MNEAVQYGLSFKKYFSALSSRFRPYALIGAGITRESTSESSGYYSLFHMQGRLGFDLYLLNSLGLILKPVLEPIMHFQWVLSTGLTIGNLSNPVKIKEIGRAHV